MSVPAPSRRGLLAATAWSVPTVLVASAAPAFATSGPVCETALHRVSWVRSGYPRPVSTMTAVGTPVTAAAVAVTFQSRLVGLDPFTDTGDDTANMTVSPYDVGGTPGPGLTLQQQLPPFIYRAGSARYQEVLFQFTRPVKGLSFTITDIDGNSGQYRDMVEVSPAPAAVSHDGTQGAGTSASPLMSLRNANVDVEARGGNATVSFAADQEIVAFRLRFWNGETSRRISGRGRQAVFVTDMTFTTSTC